MLVRFSVTTFFILWDHGLDIASRFAFNGDTVFHSTAFRMHGYELVDPLVSPFEWLLRLVGTCHMYPSFMSHSLFIMFQLYYTHTDSSILYKGFHNIICFTLCNIHSLTICLCFSRFAFKRITHHMQRVPQPKHTGNCADSSCAASVCPRDEESLHKSHQAIITRFSGFITNLESTWLTTTWCFPSKKSVE